jgi:DNA polymerase epsilon subunit 1
LLKDLHALNIGLNASYLEPKGAIFRRIFLYTSFDKGRENSRGIVGLFVLDGTNKAVPEADNEGEDGETGGFIAKAYIWLVQPGRKGDRPPMNKIFRRFCPNQSSTCKFTTVFVQTAADAYGRCNDVLSAYVRERKGPTVVIAQGTNDSRSWRKSVNLLQQFPLLLMPSSSNDEDFPTLHWQVRICNIMIQRFLVLPQWFDDRLRSARYSHVPVSNLGRDADMTMTDVLFARQLMHNRHLLWAAPGTLPDLGGAEQDRHSVWSDSLNEPIISMPGAYRNICVELEVFGLAVQAIMASGLLDAQGLTTVSASTQSDFSGGDQSSAVAATASSLSNDASCARAFALLKAEVTRWSHEFINTENLHAEVLLMGLYRYLCGRGQTLLHDPSLHRIVYALMIKLFGRLISEFKKLGSVIVYADFYRIVISTNRYDYDSVTEYIDFIVAAVMADLNMFQFIQIHVKGLWEQLLWLDSENWSGIPLDVAQNMSTESSTVENVHELADEPDQGAGWEHDLSPSEELPMEQNDDQGAGHINTPLDATCQDTVEESHTQQNEGSMKVQPSELMKGSEKAVSFESNVESDNNGEESHKDEYDFLNFSGDEESSTEDQDDEAVDRYEDEYDGYDDEDDDYYDEQLEGKTIPNSHSTGNQVAGHWDLVAFLPKAAGIYLRHAIGELNCDYMYRRDFSF